ncbi:CG2617 [Drosophila busckii]|uniref:CG2617 n=1 Tax=Drosophila busckii TaxID=30019 RepID=A0A0M4ESI7_DROBS|nr:mitochondrial ubiquitin ligase activator of NFKB 1 [Drosophila busckii]ALC40312.1 CG2617 [Drosophila busckii]
MLAIFSSIARIIDAILLQPVAAIIEAILGAVYYFFAISYFIGYFLVKCGTLIWRYLCEGYEVANVVYRRCAHYFSELCNIIFDVAEYAYYGITDLTTAIGLFLSNLLMGIGNFTIWLLMLLPRALVRLADYLVNMLYKLGQYIVEHGLHLLDNAFRLSIGIAVLLVLYMFRRYVYLMTLYALQKIYTEISKAALCAWTWANNRMSWLVQKLRIQPAELSLVQADVCVICLERGRSIVILPCRHLCLCKHCSQQLHRTEGGHRCPICRNYIDTLLQIYA